MSNKIISEVYRKLKYSSRKEIQIMAAVLFSCPAESKHDFLDGIASIADKNFLLVLHGASIPLHQFLAQWNGIAGDIWPCVPPLSSTHGHSLLSEEKTIRLSNWISWKDTGNQNWKFVLRDFLLQASHAMIFTSSRFHPRSAFFTMRL